MATLEQLSSAFLQADAAGNIADAQLFADAIRKMQSGEGMPKARTAAETTKEELKNAKTATEAFDISSKNLHGNIEAAGAAGQGRSLGILGNITDWIGKGVEAVGGQRVGQAMQDYGKQLNAKGETIVTPYREQYPVATNMGGLATDVAVTLPVGGAIGGVLKAAAPYAPSAARFIMPVAESAASGGFKTGLGPTGAVKATTGLPAYTIRDIAAEVAARGTGGALTGAVSTAITHPEDTKTGAIVGAVLPTVGAGLAKAGATGLGRGIDLVSGRGGDIKAAQIARAALGDQLEPATIALANARPGITAVQALQEAGIDAAPFMALGVFTKDSSIKEGYRRLATAQVQGMQNELATLAGGRTQTEVAESLRANKNALTDVTTPMRDVNLQAANQYQQTARRIEPYIAQKEASMVSALQGQGRAATDAAQAGVRAEAGAPGFLSQGDRAVESGVLSTEMAALKAQRQTERDFAQKQLGSLADHGLKPLDVNPIINTIDSKLADPNLYGQTQLLNVLRGLRDDFTGAVAANGGVADARALYSMRKAGISQRIDDMYGSLDPSAKQKLTAEVLASIKSPIDKAITEAGGTGWNRYLQTFETGMHELGQQRLAAIALDKFKGDQAGFLKLVRGDDKKAIEDIFGYGSDNIFKEMGRKSGQLENIASQLERDVAIETSANQAKAALARIMKMSESKLQGFPAFFDKSITTLNSALKILRGQVNEKTFAAFEKGMISGKSAAEMLLQLPTSERNSVFRILKNSSEWNPAVANVTTQLNARRKNNLAPENRNSLRP